MLVLLAASMMSICLQLHCKPYDVRKFDALNRCEFRMLWCFAGGVLLFMFASTLHTHIEESTQLVVSVLLFLLFVGFEIIK